MRLAEHSAQGPEGATVVLEPALEGRPLVVVYLHGHGRTPAGDVEAFGFEATRDWLERALDRPVALVAPHGTSRSSFGRFGSEWPRSLQQVVPDGQLAAVIGWSGGYAPIRDLIRAGHHLPLVGLLDGPYSHEDVFAEWSRRNPGRLRIVAGRSSGTPPRLAQTIADRSPAALKLVDMGHAELVAPGMRWVLEGVTPTRPASSRFAAALLAAAAVAGVVASRSR